VYFSDIVEKGVGMSGLAKVAFGLGSVMVLSYGFLAMKPALYRSFLQQFPRNKYAGWLLAAIDVAWATWLLLDMPLGFFDPHKHWLYVLAPVTFVLVIIYMKELLAPRALGALLLLIPAPLFAIVRWHESPLRKVVLVLLYLMVIKGMWLVLSPYQLRKWVEQFFKNDKMCRNWGLVGLIIAVLVIGIGLYVG
jgi:hypothetical protein